MDLLNSLLAGCHGQAFSFRGKSAGASLLGDLERFLFLPRLAGLQLSRYASIVDHRCIGPSAYMNEQLNAYHHEGAII